MKFVEINDSQFDAIVLRSSLPVLLECASPECIICKTMNERILEASKTCSSKALFLKLNVNENNKWRDYNVRVIPTLLYFKNGVLAAKQDNFPEVDEIQAALKMLVKKEGRPGGSTSSTGRSARKASWPTRSCARASSKRRPGISVRSEKI